MCRSYPYELPNEPSFDELVAFGRNEAVSRPCLLTQRMMKLATKLRDAPAGAKPAPISKECCEFLHLCFVAEPADRATVQELSQDAWIKAGRPYPQPVRAFGLPVHALLIWSIRARL